MCKKTGIKDVYQNWDEACVPGGPGGVPPASCDQHRRHGQACEVRAVGAGLKLVLKDYGLMADKFAFYLTKQFTHSSPIPSSCPIFPQTTTKLISIVL